MSVPVAIIIAAVVALLFAAGLYWRNQKDELATWARITAAALRFGFVFLLCFLLFAPAFKMEREEERKPLCFLAVDKSLSMRDAFPPQDSVQIQTLEKKLSKDFEVVNLPFGGAGTNFEQAFSDIKLRAGTRTNACVVLVSDGNANLGAEPVHAYRSCVFPLFTVCTGDTSLYPDLYVGQIQHNAYAYKGNTFPVRVQIGRSLIASGSTQARLLYKGKTLQKKEIDLKTTDETQWEIEAEQAGVFRYMVVLDEVEGERNRQNNRADFSVKVLESRRKILIVGAAPHPDIGALNQSLGAGDKYEVSVRLLDKKNVDIRKEVEAADLVILHGLPSLTANLRGLEPVLREKPLWYIVTPATYLSLFNAAETGLKISPQGNSWNESQALFNPGFAQFEIKGSEKNVYEKFPPLYAPFAKYETSGGEAVFFQSILQTPTLDPLVYLNTDGRRPVLVFTGQGLWRWRLADYQTIGNTEAFDRLTDCLVQLLSTEKPKENLVIHCPRTLPATEDLHLRAEVYNAAFERVGGQEIGFTLRNEDTREEYAFEFEFDGEFYRLDAGVLPEGDYTYKAVCQNGNEKYTSQGRLLVEAFNLENPDMSANAALMRNLALTYGGKFFYAGSSAAPRSEVWQEVYRTLRERKDLKPQLRIRELYVSLLDKTSLLLLLLSLLCLEFLFRKIFGNL